MSWQATTGLARDTWARRDGGPPPATRPKRSSGTSTARSYQTTRTTATSRPLPENGRQSSGVPIRRGRRSMPSERYGRVIWDTCWTTDRVLNRGSGRFASCGSAREGLESPRRSKDARDVVVVTQLRRTLRNGGAGWPNPVTRSARRIARRGLCGPPAGPQHRRRRPLGLCAAGMPAVTAGLDGQRVLVEQCGELLRREDPVALGHELTDLLPVRAAGEQHPDAITAGSRGEERAANGQQRLAFVWVCTQHEQRDGLAGRALPCHEQAERPPPDAGRLRPAVDPHRHLGQRQA